MLSMKFSDCQLWYSLNPAQDAFPWVTRKNKESNEHCFSCFFKEGLKRHSLHQKASKHRAATHGADQQLAPQPSQQMNYPRSH